MLLCGSEYWVKDYSEGLVFLADTEAKYMFETGHSVTQNGYARAAFDTDHSSSLKGRLGGSSILSSTII